MGRHETTGFRGYLVRVQTKQGRVYRHRNLRLVLDKSRNQGLSLQTHRLGERATVDDVEGVTSHDVGDHDSLTEGLPVVAWRSYASKDGGKKGGRSLGRYPVLEETSLDEFVQLAHANTKLPGEKASVHVAARNDVNVEDDEQVAKLYSLGILYDGPANADTDTLADASAVASAVASTDAAATTLPTTDDVASPYQADSLETIRHAEPLYTVRHVVAKRKGKRVVGHSAAKPAPLGTTDSKETSENVTTGGDEHDDSVPPLFALNGVWEDGEGQTIDGRALWSDLEEFEYVVLADDDLASMAGSWVELESVLGTDDGE